jgi:hypothetical protein
MISELLQTHSPMGIKRLLGFQSRKDGFAQQFLSPIGVIPVRRRTGASQASDGAAYCPLQNGIEISHLVPPPRRLVEEMKEVSLRLACFFAAMLTSCWTGK